MKKALSMLLTLVMVVGFGSFTFTGAAAETNGNEQPGAAGFWMQKNGDAHKLAKLFNKSEQTEADDPKEKEVIVQFADPDSADLSKTESDKIETVQTMGLEDNGAKGSKEIEISSGITVSSDEVWEFPGTGESDPVTVAVASSDKLSTEKMIQKLESQDMIEAVSPNYRRHICSGGDTYRDYQWALDAYPGMGVETEWNTGNTGSEENIVAVVDTGIDYKHEDFSREEDGCNLWENTHGNKLKGIYGFDFANGDSDPMDDNGHGTHCAGIIGAGTNGAGVQGVNQRVSLMALKVLDAEGGGYDSDIIAAFNYIYKAMTLGEPVVAINCSFGGGDDDEIMTKVINKIGSFEKKDKDGKVIQSGALTICAAGNEATNCDREPSYPACADSEYIVSVAATKSVPDAEDSNKSKAELVSFSNYGEESIDVAAPGTDILSTVSYPCFNPTLYGNDEEIAQTYLDGSEASIQKISQDNTNLDLTNPDVIKSDAAAAFFSEDGLNIKFSAPEDNKKKMQYIAIPYDLPDGYEESVGGVDMSMMIQTMDGPKTLSFDEYYAGQFSKVMLLDVPRTLLENEDFLNNAGEDILNNYVCDYQMVVGNDDYWTHLRPSTVVKSINEDGQAEYLINNEDGAESIDPANKEEWQAVDKERALLILGDSQLGGFTAHIDDIGISQPALPADAVGKYDFYSGTSMATPYVTGAAALAKAAHPDAEFGPEMLKGEILSMVNNEPPLMAGKKYADSTQGAVDFAKKGANLWIGISSVTVDPKENQVKLKGKFDDGMVEISVKKMNAQAAEEVPADNIISPKEPGENVSEIILKGDGLINNVFDITVSKTKDGKTKTASKKGIYAVKGKKEYSVFSESGSDIVPDAAMTTDGKTIYAAQSIGDSILYMINNKEFETDSIASFTKKFIQKNFESAKKENISDTANYDFRFGDDLVKIGNDLYVKGSFCDVSESGSGDDDDWAKRYASRIDDNDDDMDRFPDSTGAVFGEETYIFKVNISTGKISKVAWPNKTVSELTDSKLASYNGKLYLIGGMRESQSRFSDQVFAYNASKNKWSELASAPLPQGRAGGAVLQTGDKLVYTLGYTADNMTSCAAPPNYIFNGRAWSFGKHHAALTPIDPDNTMISRGGEEYCCVSGSVGIAKNGLVYIGIPVEDYGDTFTYDVSNDTYADTGYNFAKDMDDVYDLGYSQVLKAVAVGDRILGTDQEFNVIGINKAVKSGLITVKTSIKNGKMTGKGTCMPGTTRTVKATAKPGYYVKSLKFAGKSGKAMAKGMTAAALVTKDVTATAKTAKVKVSSVKSLTLKRGKTGSLKAKITPAPAAKQWKLAYKSSNKKYATVTAKGVVKASKNKAAKGKTVIIMIKLKGTNKTMKTVKVKIK